MILKKVTLALSVLAALFSCNSQSSSDSSTPKGWTIFDTPVESSLRGLSPVTAQIAWASGSGGVWLRTMDGGQTWDHGIIDGLDSVDFRSIHAFDAQKAIAVTAGQPARIYQTIDGGQSWEIKHEAEEETAFFDGISFANQDRGYVFGDPVDGKWTILRTVDQGSTWYPVASPDASLDEAGFAASAGSFVVDGDELWFGSGGSWANLYHSKDLGKTWEKFKTPMIQGESSQGVFAIIPVGNGELFLVGGDYLEPDSSTGNASIFNMATQKWVSVENPPSGYRSGITYYPGGHLLITVGTNGSDFSIDGGLNWVRLSDEGFHTVKLGHAGGSVWAAGQDGKIAKLNF